MIILGSTAEDYFSGTPADPRESLSFLETLHGAASRTARLVDGAGTLGRDLGVAMADPAQRGGLLALYDASERQTRMVDASSARRAAAEDVYDRMIAEVRRTTGEDWDNPLRRNTAELASRIARGEFRGWQDPRLEELIAGREDAFLARLQELKGRLGDRLNVDPFTPAPAQARANAAQAEADFKREWARTDLPLVGQGLALFAGAMVGSREDPLFWLSLPFGGPSKAAVTPVARIATSALSNATANAAFSAVAQPTVQGWRREIGVESGLGEAAQNVGMAFAIGGVAGGGLTGIGELFRGLRGRGSADRAVKAIEEAGGFVDDDTRAALRAAEMAGEADDATFRLPEGVNPQEGRQGLADAMRAAVEVDAPLPMGSRPVKPGTTDALARGILDDARDPVGALQRLREDPAAIDSALASELPDVRAAGYAATLGDAAFARVASGEADPVAASVVARMADDDAAQAALLARVIEAGARTEEAAREVVSDAIRAQNAVPAAEAAMAPPAADAAVVMRRRPQRRAPLSLLEFIASEGGLRPVGDIEAIFNGQKFVPGYGQLIRPKGMTLDRAFEGALEAGYFRDAKADAGGVYTVSFNDLLVAIEAEHRGRKLYAERDIGAIVDRDARAATADMRREIEHRMDRFFAEIDMAPAQVDPKLYKRTRDLIERGEADDPDIAFERAVMEDSHRYERVLARRKEIADDIPGWDFPDDSGPAPRPRREDPARADAGRGRAGADGEEPRAGGSRPGSSEATPAGEQLLVPGVAPVSAREAAELAAQRPLTGGEAAPPAGGLFDDAARAQMDLLDSPAVRRADPAEIRNLVPLADDAGNLVAVDRASAASAGERSQLLADLVTACKV
jgi:hypothetical protein